MTPLSFAAFTGEHDSDGLGASSSRGERLADMAIRSTSVVNAGEEKASRNE